MFPRDSLPRLVRWVYFLLTLLGKLISTPRVGQLLLSEYAALFSIRLIISQIAILLVPDDFHCADRMVGRDLPLYPRIKIQQAPQAHRPRKWHKREHSNLRIF